MRMRVFASSCGTHSTCKQPGCCSRDLTDSRALRMSHCLYKNLENQNVVRGDAVLLSLILTGGSPLCCKAGEGGYVPSPMDPGWQVYVGAVIGVIPFIIATYEFGKRVIIQRRCSVCGGSGLVLKGKYYKKCVACGGFLPWLGWRMFFFSSPGNGSPVMPPMNQKNKLFYSVPPPATKTEDSAKKEEDV